MNETYHIINKCIKQLRNLDLPKMQKLQLETLLIQVKRLLVALEGEVRDADCRKELEIDSFYDGFSVGCLSPETDAAECLRSEVERLSGKVAAMVNAVAKGK
jgi:hypothetical protein